MTAAWQAPLKVTESQASHCCSVPDGNGCPKVTHDKEVQWNDGWFSLTSFSKWKQLLNKIYLRFEHNCAKKVHNLPP